MERPYYSLSDYLKDRFKQKVYKITINAGLTCPNRDGTKGTGGCVYCEPSTLVPMDSVAGESVTGQIKRGVERVRARHGADKFIAYFQINTNTYAPVEYLRKIYEEAAGHPDVVCLAVSTRPDCLGEDVLDLLEELKLKKPLWLELGLQSASDSTLKLINRGHTAGEFTDAVLRAGGRGIDVCAHIIIGLPGEGRSEVLSTARFVAGLPVRGVKFHQLQVVKGTPLEQMYRKGELTPLGLEEYAGLVVECLEILPRGTVIHRLCGDTPGGLLIAPRWGANKFMVIGRIEKLLKAMRTYQGARSV